jgi:hypothetical protein
VTTLPEVAGLLGVDLSTPGCLDRIKQRVGRLIDVYVEAREISADERQEIRNAACRMDSRGIAGHFHLSHARVAAEMALFRKEFPNAVIR